MMVWISTEMHSKANFLYCLTEKIDWKDITCVWIHLVIFGASIRLQSTVSQEWPWGNF